MQNVSVSVIVPIYNAEKYLDACIESITKQTYPNIEIILVDDGSDDGSLEICQLWQKKDFPIKVLHQSNKGVGKARNTGIENAKGEYVAFVDADDLISDKYIEFLVYMANEYKCDISYCNHIWFKELKEISEIKNNSIDDLKVEVNSGIDALKKFFSLSVKPSIHSKLIKKSMFNDLRFSDAKRAEDMEMVFKLLRRAKRVAGDKYAFLYYYRQNPQGAISNISKKDLVDFDIRLDIYKTLKNDKEHDFDDTQNKLAMQTMYVFFDMLCDDNKKKDKDEFERAIKVTGRRLAKDMFFEENNATLEKCLLLVHPRLWKYYKIIERKMQIIMHKETLY